jgi:hypothetical protein
MAGANLSLRSRQGNQSGAQDKSVPVKSGASPEAPLGSQTTQFEPVPDPARVPAEERPVPVVAAPPVDAAAPPPPRLPPPPPPGVPPPAAPAEVDAEGEVTLEVAVALLAEVVVPDGVKVALPSVLVGLAMVGVAVVGVALVVGEVDSVGSDAAPPPAGKPLRVEALPTLPAVEVAVCAAAGKAASSETASASKVARFLCGQRVPA